MDDDARDDTELAALERLAFGRPDSRKGEKAARKAQKRLIAAAAERGALEDVAARETAARQPAAAAATASTSQAPLTLDGADSSSGPRAPRAGTGRRYVAALAIAAIVGAMAGSGITQAVIRSRPIPAADIQPAPGHGNAAAAEKYFEGVQTEVDNFPEPQWLQPLGIIESSTRAVQTSGSGAELWIGKTERDLCLMWTGNNRGTPSLETSCGTPEAFAKSGLTLVHGDEVYGWDGITFRTTTNDN